MCIFAYLSFGGCYIMWYTNYSMKILIAADLYWPTTNGVSTFSRNLAKGLADRGHDVIVVAPSQKGPQAIERDGNYTIHRLTAVPLPLYMNFRISLNPRRSITKILQEFQPDIIHVQNLMGIGQATVAAGRKLRIPIVATNHAMSENALEKMRILAPVSKPIDYILKGYGRRFHEKADYVTMPTQSALDMFIESSKPNVPVEAVSNGIDLSQFYPQAVPPELFNTFSIPKDKQIITYVGRLDGEKHIDMLIKAIALIKDTNIHALIVGDGADRARLERLAADKGVSDRIIFTGRVSDEELVQLHQVGTVFCMPSPAELQCLAALESMACAKPVVAVNAGALTELCLDGVNGYLAKTDDPADIADKLQKILGDPKQLKAFGKMSLKIAHKHELSSTLDRFVEIYNEVIENFAKKDQEVNG
ncbi:MAG: glycosyltransferase family 4 protein [Proteobacteria bacterium]|nr:MAG: glycosyltransferase family 4 protein [Pseudomonadota bacterium]